jgi:hypothetical protein
MRQVLRRGVKVDSIAVEVRLTYGERADLHEWAKREGFSNGEFVGVLLEAWKMMDERDRDVAVRRRRL